MPEQELQEGSIVRLKSGTEGWVKGQIVEYFDVIPMPGGYMYGGGMTPGYKVHILEGKHKGETIKVPANYVELLGPGKTKREPLYPHTPGKKEPLFPHVPKGRQPETKLPQTTYGHKPSISQKLYQRGADGYPIGADKIMRDAWGPIPNPDQPFWSGKGFIKPAEIYGWEWSPDYHSWRAYVRFPDGTETWTSPRTSGGSLELLASTEGDPLRKFCCRLCGERAPKELLEEGRFPDRIAWLRSHYKAKHPGVWGKVSAATQPSPNPEGWMTEFPFRGLKFREHSGGIGIQVYHPEQRQWYDIEGLNWRTSKDYYSHQYSVGLWRDRSYFGSLKFPEPLLNPAVMPTVTVEGGEPIPAQYRHLAGWVSEPLPREAE